MYGPTIQTREPSQTLASDLFEHYNQCVYEYDFGDSWQHDIIIEKRLKESKKYAVPICIDGARERPPEDVGGTGGYERFIESIMDKSDPEREELLIWAEKDTRGRVYDPEYFSVREVNRRLEYVLEDGKEMSRLFLDKEGLKGSLYMGWSEPRVQLGKRAYSWEQIGKLLTELEEGCEISIKVTGHKHRF